ncbi:hypothetical protein BV133_2428 [Blastochloris viridis]|uniref:Uncharacterized protein n=1 Tax=Blastochloris viridis TaxID=1079 RepID=A0A182D538_BLAVI|nr:hypothetical protein BV133_2428 [Blastochloris viridis]
MKGLPAAAHCHGRDIVSEFRQSTRIRPTFCQCVADARRVCRGGTA